MSIVNGQPSIFPPSHSSWVVLSDGYTKSRRKRQKEKKKNIEMAETSDGSNTRQVLSREAGGKNG